MQTAYAARGHPGSAEKKQIETCSKLQGQCDAQLLKYIL